MLEVILYVKNFTPPFMVSDIVLKCVYVLFLGWGIYSSVRSGGQYFNQTDSQVVSSLGFSYYSSSSLVSSSSSNYGHKFF